MLRVHGYIRYSSVMQDDGFSVEYQINEIKEFCKRNGLELNKVHVDQALTAKQVAGRDAFFDLLNEIQNGDVDIVIVYKMNRMFRNAEESHVYRKKFRQHKVKIISVTEPIDEETSAGRLTANMLANLDQYQSEVIADFVKSSHREMTRQGYFTGGNVPVGFKIQIEDHGKKSRSKLIIDEEIAPFLRRAFEMFADGFSVRYILHFLRDNNIRQRNGREINDKVIRRMFKNDVYIGNMRYRTEGYSELIAEAVIPALIDRELWERVQARHNAKLAAIPRKRRFSYPLTGKITCGYCGNHFFGISNEKEMKNGNIYVYRYYSCISKKKLDSCCQKPIRADFIEKIALRAVREHVLNPVMIKELSLLTAEKSGDAPAAIQAEIKKIKRQIKDHDETLDLFIEMRKKREMSPETIARKSAVIEAEIEALKKKLSDLERQNVDAILPEEVEEYLNGMLDMIDEDDGDVLRVIFENFIDEIILTNDQIEVRLFLRLKSTTIPYKAPPESPNGFFYGIVKRS